MCGLLEWFAINSCQCTKREMLTKEGGRPSNDSHWVDCRSARRWAAARTPTPGGVRHLCLVDLSLFLLGSQLKWRKETQEANLQHLQREELVPTSTIPPWSIPKSFTTSPDLIEAIYITIPPKRQKEAAVKTIEELQRPDVKTFTDGSATIGIDLCGGGVYIKTYDPGDEDIEIDVPAGGYDSSFRAEATALNTAMMWVVENEKKCRDHIFTDPFSGPNVRSGTTNRKNNSGGQDLEKYLADLK